MTMRIDHVRSAASVTLAIAVTYGVIGLVAPSVAAVPVSLRFVLAVLAMSFAPGYAVLDLTKGWRNDGLNNVALAFVLSLSTNLALNLLAMTAGTSLRIALVPYLLATLAALVIAGRARRESTSAVHRLTWLGAVLIAGVAALVWWIYRVGPPNVGAEELVIINRLATNPHLHFNNISFQQGMPATYLLVSHQQLIAAIALMAHIEPLIAQPLFWCVTAAVGIAALALLAIECAASPLAGPLAVGLLAVAGLFESESFTYQFGFGFPFPNRYGIAPGILLPLILVFFWQRLREPEPGRIGLFVLVYLILEITFVHAREAIIALSCIVAIGLFGAQGPNRRAALQLTAATVICSVAALLLYRWLTLTFSTDLGSYVEGMRTALWDQLRQLYAENGLRHMVWADAPSTISVGPTTVEVSSYGDVVARLWSSDPGRYTTRLLFTLTFITLPLAMWRPRTPFHRAAGAVISVWGVILNSGAAVLLVAYLVGNPEVLLVTNMVGLLLFCCLICWLVTIAEWVARKAEARRWALWAFAAAALGLGAYLGLAPSDPIGRLVRWLTSVLTGWTPILLHVATLAVIAAAWHRFAPRVRVAASGRTALAAATALLLLIAVPVAARGWHLKSDLFRRQAVTGRVAGRAADDYALIRDAHQIVCSLPFEAIAFLRALPPGQNAVAQDSFCVAAMTPHYVVINSQSGRALHPSSIVNLKFMNLFPETAGIDPASPAWATYTLKAFDTPERWQRLIDAFRIDLVVIEPGERSSLDHLLAKFGETGRAAPVVIWRGDSGYEVVSVHR